MKDLADAAVDIFAGAQIDLVAADHGFLGIAFAAVGQFFALAHALDPLHHPFDDAFGDLRRAGRMALGQKGFERVLVLLLVIGDELRIERLRQFRAVAVKRIGLDREAPGQQIGRSCNPRRVASLGMLMVLEIAPEMKGCAAAIMRMWLSTER